MNSPRGKRTYEDIEESLAKSGTDRVIINVGGVRHECYISTIQNFPDTRLYWIAETALKMADFDPDGNEFFFDRHPGCFQNILNYCRTGKLHCPNDVCGPLFEEELAFWGVNELMMEPCCWASYTQHREASKNLKVIDEIYDHSSLYNIKEASNGYIKKKMQEIWLLLEQPQKSISSQIVAVAIIFVILASMTTFCLETMPSFKDSKHIFDDIEIFYCIFFTIDFLLRLICCPQKKLLLTNILTWIDFIATLQFYIGFIAQNNVLNFLFMFRLLRIFRLIRFFKDLTGMLVIGQTLKASAKELLLLGLILFVPMMIFSTMIYHAEQATNGEKFESIPASFWWAIITLTTVGYGDITPISVYGKFVGAACAYFGVLMVALPISVIGNNFSLYYSYAQARMRLPKREENLLWSADKMLIQNEGHQTDTTTSSGTCSPECENPKRTRRHAIRSSFGPISMLQKHSKLIQKELAKGSVPLLAAPSTPKIPEENGEKPKQDESKKENRANHKLNNTKKENVFSILSPETRKERSATMYYNNNHRKNEDQLSVLRLSKSQENVLEEDNRLNSPSPRKRVLHLDISSYVPKKVTLKEFKERRKISTLRPAQNVVREERSSSENVKRKISAINRGHNTEDVIVWLENTDQDTNI